MLGSYWRIIIAVAGLVLAAFAQPEAQNREQPNSAAQPKIEQSLRDIAASPSEANRPSNLVQPCDHGESNRSSDLCAQWKAADAAESAANAAWLFGTLGTLIGAFTLAAAIAAAFFAKKAADHTESGAKAAQDAVEETQRIGEAQIRCYLSIKRPQITFINENEVMVSCRVFNSGQSPALQVRWCVVISFIMDSQDRTSPVVKGSEIDTFEMIGSQELCRPLPVIVEFTLNHKEKMMLRQANNEGIGIIASITVTAEDVFGNEVFARQNFLNVIHDVPERGQKFRLHRLGQR